MHLSKCHQQPFVNKNQARSWEACLACTWPDQTESTGSRPDTVYAQDRAEAFMEATMLREKSHASLWWSAFQSSEECSVAPATRSLTCHGQANGQTGLLCLFGFLPVSPASRRWKSLHPAHRRGQLPQRAGRGRVARPDEDAVHVRRSLLTLIASFPRKCQTPRARRIGPEGDVQGHLISREIPHGECQWQW